MKEPLRNNLPAFAVYLLVGVMLTGSAAVAQQFNHVRRIAPFTVRDLNGSAYDLPFTGGINRPVVQFVDIDGDGDQDLFLQDRADLLTFFRNDGTANNYQFTWVTDRFQGVTVGEWFKFADVDLDGDIDLFTEKPFGKISYYRNNGSIQNPDLQLIRDELTDTGGQLIQVDGFSIPEWADIDCDNDLELFLGRQDGRMTLYETTGLDPDGVPRYVFVTDAFEDLQIITGGGDRPAGIDGSRHGANSLSYVDIDNDTDNDLFWGDFFAPSIIYIENSGSCANPDLNITFEEYPPGNPLSSGGYNVPRFSDIDGDMDMDMFIGILGGSVSFIDDLAENFYYYENTGTIGAPQFVLRTHQFIDHVDVGKNSIVALTDIDDDGDLDLILASEQALDSPSQANSHLLFFENQGSPAQPDYRLVDDNYLDYDKRNDLNYAPAFVDIDGDSDRDLFIGKWDGSLTYYRNDGSAASANFTRIDERYGNIDIGNNSAPAFGDLDDDGDLDLIIGEFSGNLNYFRNDGTALAPNFVVIDNTYLGVDRGEHSYPVLLDIDSDNDLDMFIGSDTSGTILYRNDGTPQAAAFVPAPGYGFPRHLRTSPTYADMDNDGDLDIFSGASGGGIIYYENLDVVGIDPDASNRSTVPGAIRLLDNYPNPFNPETHIRYTLQLAAAQLGGSHQLLIFNNLGQQLRTWRFSNSALRIEQTVTWDGLIGDGRPAPSGIYFYELRIDNAQRRVGKMLLSR